MIFVPHVPTAHPTPRSRALAERLRATIADFQVREPKVTDEEIALALREAQPHAPTPPQNRMISALVALAAGLVAFGLVLATLRDGRAGEAPPTIAISGVIVALLVACAVLMVRLRSRR